MDNFDLFGQTLVHILISYFFYSNFWKRFSMSCVITTKGEQIKEHMSLNYNSRNKRRSQKPSKVKHKLDL